ncbi:hypothetical protein BC628DRAFT_131836 [Trametes gibbosa]|nr:hypothetical protein BC628DRAFT_131836 [Trametes gibbosa]
MNARLDALEQPPPCVLVRLFYYLSAPSPPLGMSSRRDTHELHMGMTLVQASVIPLHVMAEFLIGICVSNLQHSCGQISQSLVVVMSTSVLWRSLCVGGSEQEVSIPRSPLERSHTRPSNLIYSQTPTDVDFNTHTLHRRSRRHGPRCPHTAGHTAWLVKTTAQHR